MALFITLGLISRPSAKMLSLVQHPDYAQHLSVYAVSCTVRPRKSIGFQILLRTKYVPSLGQNPLKDVDSRVFTRMLHSKNLTL